MIEVAVLELSAHIPRCRDLAFARALRSRAEVQSKAMLVDACEALVKLHLGLGKVAAILDEVVPTRDAQQVVRLAFDEDHVVGLDLERHKTRDYI